MDDACRVNVFQAAKHLINEELHVIICQPLCADDVVQISSHKMRNKVDLREIFQGRPVVKRIEETNYVLMVHVLQQTQLSESSLSMRSCLKGSIKFLDGHLHVREFVSRRAAKTIIELCHRERGFL